MAIYKNHLVQVIEVMPDITCPSRNLVLIHDGECKWVTSDDLVEPSEELTETTGELI